MLAAGEASGAGSTKKDIENLAKKIQQAQKSRNDAETKKQNARSDAERQGAEQSAKQADKDQKDAEERLSDIAKNAPSKATGMVMMGTMAEGMCHRKTRMTALTMMISSSSSCWRLSIERWMSSGRS